MKVFHCTHCQHLIFFENSTCLECKHLLAYLPDLDVVGALSPVDGDSWRYTHANQERTYRLCENYIREDICNWAIPVDQPQALCQSCRFTQVVPNLSDPGNKAAWYKLELAKRRLLYTLMHLGCGVKSKIDDPRQGLAFAFLAETKGLESPSVLTGHVNGLITINIAEADDVERERRRQQLHEPYRTLLGHFRHEVGHYYWDRLIKDNSAMQGFREYFGDERRDYAQALQDYYKQGPPQDWPSRYVSAYATAHPWEDWAETWAHYLHLTDTLETAVECGLSIQPRRPDEPKLRRELDLTNRDAESFNKLIEGWFSLTYVLNNLNRGLGLPDGFPFVLSTAAIDKLRLVHMTIGHHS
jgi:hypothetical protein